MAQRMAWRSACWLLAGAAWAQAQTLPAGTGLAARHPGDRGLAGNRRVLFADDFERGTIAEIGRRWGNASNRGGKALALAEDGPPASRGQRCLQVTATLGENTGGHLYTRLKRGVDRAYARFYVKFPQEAGYIHHFVHLGGYHPPTLWPQGGAGTRPQGHERFTAGIEPFGRRGRVPPPGEWSFYVYWHEMKMSADGKYWGNGLGPEQPVAAPRGRWQCVEVMLKLNEPGRRDGELALWLDGKLTAHFKPGVRRTKWTGMGFRLRRGGEPFEGFSWRTTAELKINFFWLLHYVTEGALRRNRVQDPPRTNRVFFDQVVVATEYIGPLAPAKR
ncbi:MAG: hypothetical protein ACYTEZ_16200 [Planctomycetota bacterium]